MYKVRDSINC